MLTPAQIRGARAMLGLKQSELAERAGISKTGLINIESGSADPKASTLSAIQRALEAAGVEFTNGGEPGVKLRKQAPITEAEILERAKANCAREGAAWELEVQTHPGRRFVPIVRSMDEIGRRAHLARAKAELVKERGP